MIDLIPLFTTVAQISFTLAGFVVVVIMGDKVIRESWLQEKPRASYVFIVLLFLVMPGLIALGGLIQPRSDIPSWPFSSTPILVIYFILLREILNALHESGNQETLILEGTVNAINFLRRFITIFAILSIIGVLTYYLTSPQFSKDLIEILLGSFLGLSIFSSSVVTILMLKADADIRKKDHEKKSVPMVNDDFLHGRKPAGRLSIITAVLIISIMFFVGLFTPRKKSK